MLTDFHGDEILMITLVFSSKQPLCIIFHTTAGLSQGLEIQGARSNAVGMCPPACDRPGLIHCKAFDPIVFKESQLFLNFQLPDCSQLFEKTQPSNVTPNIL